MRISAGMRRYRPNLTNRREVIAISRPQRFLDGLNRRLDLHLSGLGLLQALSGQALFYPVHLDLAEPLHHHVDAKREAEGLDDILEVKQRRVTDNAAGRQQVGALHCLKREESLFDIL